MKKDCRIVTVVLEDTNVVPLGNEPVLFEGRIVGKTTSAAFGFRVGSPIALADLSDPQARVYNARVSVDIAGDLCAGVVISNPVFDPDGLRMRPGI